VTGRWLYIFCEHDIQIIYNLHHPEHDCGCFVQSLSFEADARHIVLTASDMRTQLLFDLMACRCLGREAPTHANIQNNVNAKPMCLKWLMVSGAMLVPKGLAYCCMELWRAGTGMSAYVSYYRSSSSTWIDIVCRCGVDSSSVEMINWHFIAVLI
jgi:hypothetical protein